MQLMSMYRLSEVTAAIRQAQAGSQEAVVLRS
jgi:hypothetical protein